MNPQIKISEACKPLNLLIFVFCLALSSCNGGGGSGSSRSKGQDGDLGQEVHRSSRWESEMVRNHLEGNLGEPEFTAPGEMPASETWPEMDYWIYQPASASERPAPMLVIYLHGTSQTPISAALGVRWNELADERGVIVVYPHGPGENWEWGLSTQYGRGVGPLESVARITREMQARFGIGPDSTFVGGASSGAISATMLGALYVELYSGVMSALGCSYSCIDPRGALAYLAMGSGAKVVPAFLVHGTLDAIFPPPLAAMADSQWVGSNDLADNGLPDFSVSPIPAVDLSHFAQADAGSKDAYPYQIHHYRDREDRVVVESWYIHGLAHNYPYGDPEGDFTDPKGPDITAAAYQFFDLVRGNQ